MLDAAPLEVWLETEGAARAVVPYVRAAARTAVDYRIVVQRTGLSGQTNVAQGGRKLLEPEAATPLGSIGVTRSPHDVCTVEVSIAQEGAQPREFRFDCPSR